MHMFQITKYTLISQHFHYCILTFKLDFRKKISSDYFYHNGVNRAMSAMNL